MSFHSGFSIWPKISEKGLFGLLFLFTGHSQSYNPPPEYLMRKLDQNMLEGNIPLNEDKLFKNFWRKFSSVRQIPSYRPFIKVSVFWFCFCKFRASS